MEKEKQPYKSVRVFENPILERLTHVHPITPLLVWVPVISYLLYSAFEVHQMSLSVVLSIGVLALVTWTLTEYILHRFVFHFEPSNAWQERLVFLIHGLHHEDPQDPTRLVMPPTAGIILGGALYGLFTIFLGTRWVQPFFAFFLIGYLCYDYIHFGVHHFAIRSRVGKFLKQSHMIHHYVSPNARWGVSSPLWDYVFGTLEEKKENKQAV